MSLKTNIHIELSDLNPADLAKVVDLIDTLGQNVVSYSILTSEDKPRPPQIAYRKVDRVVTPYAKSGFGISSDDVESIPLVTLDIEPTTTNISPVEKKMTDSEEMKSNIKKFL